MTGSAADADDVVQDAFARALTKPPDPSRPIHPWLVSVTMNLSRDLLRRRKTRGYVGPWLPGPSTDPGDDLPDLQPSSEARYGLKESATFAFLIALEALTPLQRAVLLLRDVLDYSVHETAECLDSNDDAVKSAHLRARKAMQAYDASRQPEAELDARTRRALERLLMAMGEGPAALAALLSDDVRAVTDGGGEFAAALLPIKTPAKVARFMVGLGSHTIVTRADFIRANGLPAVLVEQTHRSPRAGKRVLMRVEIDASDRIRAIHVVIASRKLGRLFD
jgi:RNA polymerase sigma-70 factor (ECF subfamily)